MPSTLRIICEKRGIRPARILRVPDEEERAERARRDPLPDKVYETTKRMLRDAQAIECYPLP